MGILMEFVMETIVQSVIFISIIVVFGVDASRKRREFLKKRNRT
ncbi:hypothetical protein ANAEL_04924 [Anaerolineales bacterium]|nr:hypothetical protein ANAEL_04924 [Anaerolineales bacterium]